MARTIKEIANGMKSDFIGNEDLCTAFGLTYDDGRGEAERIAYYDDNFSAVSVETSLIYVVAACAAAIENMFDWFKEDVDNVIANERYGHKGWYVKKAKEFEWNGERIISHASCEELDFGVRLKVAKSDGVDLYPLDNAQTNDEFGGFQHFMNREKPAGMPISFVNEQADSLKLNIDCHYDPLVFTGGSEAAVGSVISCIVAHINSIDFNGVFTTTALVDALQTVPGLSAIEIISAQAARQGENYVPFVSTYNPRSGYLRLDEQNSVITVHPIQ